MVTMAMKGYGQIEIILVSNDCFFKIIAFINIKQKNYKKIYQKR